jgi:hypothetical protein
LFGGKYLAVFVLATEIVFVRPDVYDWPGGFVLPGANGLIPQVHLMRRARFLKLIDFSQY